MTSAATTPLAPALTRRHGGKEWLDREWDELVDRTGAPPWLRPGWIRAWWSAFGHGDLQVLRVWRNETIAGVLPVARTAFAVSSPTNWHTPEFGLVAEDDEARRGLARALFAAAPTQVSLSMVSDERGLQICRDEANARRYRTLTRPMIRSPFVELGGDWSAYERTLRPQFRKDIRRRARRLAEAGAVSFDVEDGRTGLESLLAEGFRVEASGWKGRAGTAIVSDETTHRFYGEISRWAAERGSLRLAFLRVDGRAIAFELMLEENGVLYDVKTGYDEAYARYSPGHLLVREILRWAAERGVHRYEFLGEEDTFKREWARGVRERKQLRASAPTPLGFLGHATHAYARPVARRVLALRR